MARPGSATTRGHRLGERHSSGNIHDLSADTFRIDYYSALKMLDQIEQAYAK